jgi:hypothetical protein
MKIINVRIWVWLLLLATVIIVAFFAVVHYWYYGGPDNFNFYNSVVPQVQNAVTTYMIENDGELPPTEGTTTMINISNYWGFCAQDCQVLDICSLVREGVDYLRTVPYSLMGSTGDAGTNFYTGNCTRSTEENGHYIFFVDSEGNVYTGCDCNENGVIEEDGMENVSEYSGNCTKRDISP